MSITGHKTVSTFQRYKIVAPADKRAATKMLEVSQGRERELLKNPNYRLLGKVSGKVHEKHGKVAKSPSQPNRLHLWLIDCARMG